MYPTNSTQIDEVDTLLDSLVGLRDTAHQRAEYVMLNKGDFILKGVTTLDTILTRIGAHQFKRTANLRALQSWQSIS